MKIITINSQVLDTIGLQDIDNNKKYIFLPYIVELKVEEGILLYNLLTRIIVLLEKDEDKENLSKQIYNWMIQHWFYIPNDVEPKTIVYMFNKVYAKRYPRPTYDKLEACMIYTTTDCNARCPYCYENGISKISMTETIAKDVGNYLVKHCSKKIVLRWFGGEPLCNTKAMDIICNILKDNNIEYSSTITSNGLLFHKHNISQIIDLWKTERCQITLDGTRDIYNATKGFLNIKEDAYEQVLQNIQYLSDLKVIVTIRLNLSTTNYEDLYKLISELNARFHGNQYIRIYTSMLFENEGNPPLILTDSQKEKMFKQLSELDNYCYDCGLYLKHGTPKVGRHHCMADNGRANVIRPDGSLGLCTHYFDESYGTIYSDISNIKILNSFLVKEREKEECKDCFYYPQCIRLKKCPTKHVCNDNYKQYRMEHIQLIMSEIYERYKNINKIT